MSPSLSRSLYRSPSRSPSRSLPRSLLRLGALSLAVAAWAAPAAAASRSAR